MKKNKSYNLWCKNKKEWEQDPWAISPDGRIFNPMNRRRYRPETHILVESTGKKDRNNNEIYTGTIISVFMYGESKLLICEWNKDSLRYQFRDVHNDDMYLVIEIDFDDCLIAGHKFTDPEMANIKEAESNDQQSKPTF